MNLQNAFKGDVENLERRLDEATVPIVCPEGMSQSQHLKQLKRATKYHEKAIEKLEECYMYIGKFVRDRQILRGVPSPDSPERGQ